MVGIDKLILTTGDFQVTDLKHPLFVKKAVTKGDESLPRYTDLKGQTIEANNFFINEPHLTATYDFNQRHGLRIVFNPSKKIHPYKLSGTGDTLNRISDKITAELNSLGIQTNLDTMNINRIDLAKNCEMSQPLFQYHRAFAMLKGKRTQTKDFGETYYIGNKGHETCFYDKRIELIGNKISVDELPDNFMRGENRFKKTMQVKKHTGISTFAELKETKDEYLNECRVKFMTNVIFSRSKLGDQLMINYDSEIEFFKRIKESRKKGYFLYWLSLQAIDGLIYKFGSMKNIERFLFDAGENRKVVWSSMNRLKELSATASLLKNNTDKITASDLLNEIVEKFGS
jgi:hypothetical protein